MKMQSWMPRHPSWVFWLNSNNHLYLNDCGNVTDARKVYDTLKAAGYKLSNRQ